MFSSSNDSENNVDSEIDVSGNVKIHSGNVKTGESINQKNSISENINEKSLSKKEIMSEIELRPKYKPYLLENKIWYDFTHK